MNKLERIKVIDFSIAGKTQELRHLNAMLITARVSSYDEKVQSDHSADDQLISLMTKITELEKSITDEIAEMVDLKIDVMRQVDALEDPNLIDFAYKRYFEFKSYRVISEEMFFTVQWLHKLNNKLVALIK